MINRHSFLLIAALVAAFLLPIPAAAASPGGQCDWDEVDPLERIIERASGGVLR